MSGCVFTIQFNDKSIKDVGMVLKNVGDVVDDLTPVWDEFLPFVREAIAANFARQGNIEEPWTPLDPAYAKRKAAAGYGNQPILVCKGNLRAAATQDAPGNIVEMDAQRFFYGVDTTVIPYARAHDQSGIRRSDGLVVRKYLMLDVKAVHDGLRRIIARMIKEAQGPGWARAARAGGKL
jgi:hypothetical protein